MDLSVSLVATVSPRRRASPMRLADAPGREQRAFYLHEMDIARIRDAGIRHRGAHAGRNLIDLREAAMSIRSIARDVLPGRHCRLPHSIAQPPSTGRSMPVI
jgi:hypothetical protein